MRTPTCLLAARAQGGQGRCPPKTRGWLPWVLLLTAFGLAPCLSGGCGAEGNGGPPAPVELVVPLGHNIGLDCTAPGCHNDSGSLPRLSAAGTVYTDPAGSAPASEVTVRLLLVSNPAVSVSATTNQDGNFALAEVALDAAEEYSMSVTDGTTSQSMAIARTPAISCNWCHSPAGPAGFRVNLQGAP